MRYVLGVLIFGALAAHNLAAQPACAKAPRRLNHDLPSFTLTEFTYAHEWSRERRHDDRFHWPAGGRMLTWELGGMSNLSPTRAVGGTMFATLSTSGGRFGVKGRVRRWLGSQAAVDVSAGIIMRGSVDHDDMDAPGLVGEVALNGGDLIALVARVDLMPAGGRTHSTVFIGARGGSEIGIGAGLGYIVVATMIMFASLGGT